LTPLGIETRGHGLEEPLPVAQLQLRVKLVGKFGRNLLWQVEHHLRGPTHPLRVPELLIMPPAVEAAKPLRSLRHSALTAFDEKLLLLIHTPELSPRTGPLIS